MTVKKALVGLAVAVAVGACTNAADFQSSALRILLDEEGTGKSTGQFSRFSPLREAGRGPALDVRILASGLRGGFLREAKQGNIESWLGTDGISLSFDRGVLHGTQGLGGAGLSASDVSASASAILARRSTSVDRIHTYLNGNDQAAIRAFSCEIRNEGVATVTLDIGTVTVTEMTETCRNLDQTFENTYWVSQSRGGIVKSRQWAGPIVGDMQITKVYNF